MLTTLLVILSIGTSRSTSSLALQSRLGLLPERGIGAAADHRDSVDAAVDAAL